MAAEEEVGVKIVRIVYDASKAREGAKEARRSLEEIERQAQQTGAVISRMEGGLDVLGAGFARVTRFAAAFGVALTLGAGIGFAKDIMQTVGSLGTLADQLTTNTTYLQAMQTAATGANVKIDDLEKGAAAFALKIGQAAEGNKEAIETFQRLGVKILDARGAVRPFNDLLTESAQKLDRVENANVKVALSTEVFDKAGRKMLSLLPELSKGQEALSLQAERAGTVISPEAIEKWDRLGSAAEKAGLQVRAFFAEAAAPVATDGFEKISAWLGTILGQFERGKASGQGFWATVLQDSRTQGRIGTGPNALRLSTPQEEEADRRATLLKQKNDPNNSDPQRQAMIQEDLDRLNRQTLLDKQASFDSEEGWARRYKLAATAPVAAGVRDPSPKGAGAGDAERIEKLRNTMAAAAEAQDAMTAAALRGSVAFQEQDIKAKSLEQAMQAYGDKLDRNNPRVKALAAEIEGFNRKVVEGKAAESFAVATTELEKQNVLIAAELRLVNQLPEVRAREIAAIKAAQEAEKGGQAITAEMLEARQKAIEQNEMLKSQAEDLKRANELWTEPLKRALGDIQSTAADMWEKILENGKFSMEEFGQLFIKTARRAAAELLALSTIRPVIGMGVEALGSLGLVSPGTARDLGYGTVGTSGAGGGLGGSMSGGLGWFGSSFSGVGDWLRAPVASLFSSSAPAGGYADVGALLASGNTGASASASGIGGIGGISIGQGLGALAGAGMGIYNLATANGNTGKTIGGIGSIIGAGVSLIPGIGQIAGPIISILSSIVPSLFGESDSRTHSSTNANLRYGSGGWYTTGGAYGSGANSGQSESALRGTTAGIDSVFDLMGGVKDASKVWGLNLSSWTAQGKDWSYTSNATHLVDPNGNREAWRMNMSDMMDTGAAQVAIRSILSGAVGEISTTMKGALEHMRAASMGIKETAESIVFVDEVYERLGKGALTVRAQFRELEKQFGDMTDTAKKLGLSLEPVIAEQKKQTERLGQDYVDNLIDPIAAGLRAWEDEKQSILANVDYISQHTDVVVDMARINEALLRKEAALKEELYGGAVSQLEDAIRRLTPGGDLANLDPSGTLAGMRASYQSTYAQASAGDAAAVGRFGAESTAYAEYARSYFAGSAEYEAIRQQIIEALRTIQTQVVGPVTPASNGAAPPSNGNDAQFQQLMSTVAVLVEQGRQKDEKIDRLTGLVDRLVANGSRG